MIVETLVDDLDRKSRANETVAFAIDGVRYVIDLTDPHAKKFRKILEPYRTAGTKVGREPAEAVRPTRKAVPYNKVVAPD